MQGRASQWLRYSRIVISIDSNGEVSGELGKLQLWQDARLRLLKCSSDVFMVMEDTLNKLYGRLSIGLRPMLTTLQDVEEVSRNIDSTNGVLFALSIEHKTSSFFLCSYVFSNISSRKGCK